MNDEMLQDDVTESVDNTQVEDSQEVAESQEVAPKNDDFVELTPEQQKRVNKLTWEKNEAIRKAKALEEQLNAKPQEVKPVEHSSTTAINVPDPDLAYSDPDAYQRQASEWQASVIRAAREEAAKAARSVVDETKTASEQAAQQAKSQEIVQKYSQRAIESGLDAQKLFDAEQVFVAYNPSQDLREFILADANGPHLMNYLVDHQSELESLVSMPPMRAALHLEKLRGKALNANHGTKAPDPLEPLGGRGMVEDESPLLRGATFS